MRAGLLLVCVVSSCLAAVEDGAGPPGMAPPDMETLMKSLMPNDEQSQTSQPSSTPEPTKNSHNTTSDKSTTTVERTTEQTTTAKSTTTKKVVTSTKQPISETTARTATTTAEKHTTAVPVVATSSTLAPTTTDATQDIKEYIDEVVEGNGLPDADYDQLSALDELKLLKKIEDLATNGMAKAFGTRSVGMEQSQIYNIDGLNPSLPAFAFSEDEENVENVENAQVQVQSLVPLQQVAAAEMELSSEKERSEIVMETPESSSTTTVQSPVEETKVMHSEKFSNVKFMVGHNYVPVHLFFDKDPLGGLKRRKMEVPETTDQDEESEFSMTSSEIEESPMPSRIDINMNNERSIVQVETPRPSSKKVRTDDFLVAMVDKKDRIQDQKEQPTVYDPAKMDETIQLMGTRIDMAIPNPHRKHKDESPQKTKVDDKKYPKKQILPDLLSMPSLRDLSSFSSLLNIPVNSKDNSQGKPAAIVSEPVRLTTEPKKRSFSRMSHSTVPKHRTRKTVASDSEAAIPVKATVSKHHKATKKTAKGLLQTKIKLHRLPVSSTTVVRQVETPRPPALRAANQVAQQPQAHRQPAPANPLPRNIIPPSPAFAPPPRMIPTEPYQAADGKWYRYKVIRGPTVQQQVPPQPIRRPQQVQQQTVPVQLNRPASNIRTQPRPALQPRNNILVPQIPAVQLNRPLPTIPAQPMPARNIPQSVPQTGVPVQQVRPGPSLQPQPNSRLPSNTVQELTQRLMADQQNQIGSPPLSQKIVRSSNVEAAEDTFARSLLSTTEEPPLKHFVEELRKMKEQKMFARRIPNRANHGRAVARSGGKTVRRRVNQERGRHDGSVYVPKKASSS